MVASFLHTDNTIEWICALLLEMAAGSAMLDKIGNRIPNPVLQTCFQILIT